jgi:3-hydroxyisobutyrate dehydrogenase
MIGFLGMGLLGSNFVRAALARGEQVQVWNRTAERARALASAGARVCTTPEAAVRGASRVHLTLSDDAAVDDVLTQARAGFEGAVVVIDHTTTSPAGTRARAERFANEGIEFVHAPVFMGPKNALDATGVMLASGDLARFERVRPELAKMTGKLVYLGPDVERAASFKLLGNLFLMFMTGGLVEMFTLAKGLGISSSEAAELFAVFNPAVTLPARVERILAANFSEPSWELQMARKDARLMIEAAQQGAAPLNVLPSIAELMDRFIARGHAHDDWTVIASDALRTKG